MGAALSSQLIPQPLDADGMPQFFEGLCLNLPYALPRHTEHLPDLFERVLVTTDAEALADYAFLSRAKTPELLPHDGLRVGGDKCPLRRSPLLVSNLPDVIGNFRLQSIEAGSSGTFIRLTTISRGNSARTAIIPASGSRPVSYCAWRRAFSILRKLSWTWTGKRIVRSASATARVMLCLIHHTA